MATPPRLGAGAAAAAAAQEPPHISPSGAPHNNNQQAQNRNQQQPLQAFPEGGFPYCQKSRQLLLELKRSPDWLPQYNEDTIRQVVEECSSLERSIHQLQLQLEQQQQQQAEDHHHTMRRRTEVSIQTYHLCICRNKRALLAYLAARTARIEAFYWDTGAPAMPLEFAQKLSRRELEYYAEFQQLVTRTMDSMDLDLLAHRQPPGTNLLVKIRCLHELGQVMLQSGAAVVLSKDSTHFLRRDDVEHFIRQHLVEEEEAAN